MRTTVRYLSLNFQATWHRHVDEQLTHSGEHGNTDLGRTKKATPIARHRLLPEKAVQCCTAKVSGSSISPVTEPTPIEPDALSRFEGEGGREFQIPEWVDVPLDNAIWRRPAHAHQTNQ